MTMQQPLQVFSEIGLLRSVLLKRPGKELENLTPDNMTQLLFDDIPYLPLIQQEHDHLAEILRREGTEVLYLEKLLGEVLEQPEIAERFIADILDESKQTISCSALALKEYLSDFKGLALAEVVMAGICKSTLPTQQRNTLNAMVSVHHPFYLDPMPNLYFTRDPAATIGNGLTLNKMKQSARRRESLFMQYIMEYHPRFNQVNAPVWLDRSNPFSIEGGDELILNRETLAIGISSRTDARSVQALAHSIFSQQNDFIRIVAIEIPESRAFMHLDTVFTMVNHDQFTIHPAILDKNQELNIFILEKCKDQPYEIKAHRNLLQVLKTVLQQSEIDLIPCGGNDPIAAAREQWNDGSNTLAIAPGVVVTYDRNYVSNAHLQQHGIRVITTLSSELARGRGGPRCMSMPLFREMI